MRHAPIILFGVGGVGSALIRQIVQNRAHHATEFELELPIAAVCDRDGAVVALGEAIEDVTLLDIIDFKSKADGSPTMRKAARNKTSPPL